MSPCKTLRVVLVILTALTGIVVIRRPCDTVLVLVLAIGIWMVLDGSSTHGRSSIPPDTVCRALPEA